MENFLCKLCNREIIGIHLLKLHLVGRRHNRNKVKDYGIMNISTRNSESEEELVEAHVNTIEKSIKSCKKTSSDIPVPAKFWLKQIAQVGWRN